MTITWAAGFITPASKRSATVRANGRLPSQDTRRTKSGGACPISLEITERVYNESSTLSRPITINLFNRISGKSMLKNKSPRIARMSMGSYIGHLRDERIIAHVIVDRVSSLKSKQRKQLTTT